MLATAGAVDSGTIDGIVVQHLALHNANTALIAGIVRRTFDDLTRRFGPSAGPPPAIVETASYEVDDMTLPISSAGNLVAVPERLGWLHDARNPLARDWLNFVLGREIARRWWGRCLAAPVGPGAMLVDEGMPMLIGLQRIAATDGLPAADRYADILRDRMTRQRAGFDGPATAPEQADDEPYAPLQGGLALYERWRRNPHATDALLDRTARHARCEEGRVTLADPSQLSAAVRHGRR